jgi:hypothetical protein
MSLLVSEKTAATTLTPSISFTNGNRLFLVIESKRSTGAARTVSSVASTHTTGWALVGSRVANGSFGLELWSGTSTASATETITVTMSGTTASQALKFFEVQSSVGSTVDATMVTLTGTSTSPSTGNYTSTQANDFWIAACMEASTTAPTVQPGGSWSNMTFASDGASGGVQVNYISGVAISTLNPSWTIGNVAWGTLVVALKVTDTTTTKTQTGVTNIRATTARTQSGKGDVRKTTTNIQTGKANLNLRQDRTQTGKGDIYATTTRTASGKGSLVYVAPSAQSISRTALGTIASPAASVTTLIASLTLAAGDLLIVETASNGNIDSFLSWGAGNFSTAIQKTRTVPSGHLSIQYLYIDASLAGTNNLAFSPLDSADYIFAVLKVKGTLGVLDAVESGVWSSASPSDPAVANAVPVEFEIGALATIGGTTSDAAGTWQNSWSAGQRANVSATTPVTIQEGYKIAASSESSQAALTGITSRPWIVVHATFRAAQLQLGVANIFVHSTRPQTGKTRVQVTSQAQTLAPLWTQALTGVVDGTVLGGGFLWMSQNGNPATIVKMDLTNPAGYSSASFANDGNHKTTQRMVYTGGFVYALFASADFALRVTQIDPSTLAMSDVITDTNYPYSSGVGMSLSTDGTNLYIGGTAIIDGNSRGIVIKYQISGFSRLGELITDLGTDQGYNVHCVPYDGTKLYAAGFNTAHSSGGWVARVTTALVMEAYALIPSGFHTQFSADGSYMYGMGTGSPSVAARIDKSTLEYRPIVAVGSTGQDGLFNDGTYLWGAPASLNRIVRIDPSAYEIRFFAVPSFGNYNRFHQDGTRLVNVTSSGVIAWSLTDAQTTTYGTRGKANIRNTTDRTQTGKASMTGGNTTTDRTQTGKADMQATTPRTQTGKARAQNTTIQTTTGKARAQVTTDQTQQGKARAQITTLKTQAGAARAQITTARTQSAVSRLRITADRTQGGKVRMQNTAAQPNTGKARIISAVPPVAIEGDVIALGMRIGVGQATTFMGGFG